MRLLSICLLAAMAMAQPRLMPRPMQPSEPTQPAPPPTPTGTSSIEGTVSDAVTQAPLKKVQVMLNGPVGSLTAVTDASGRFAFRQLPAGNYWINPQRQGYSPPQAMFMTPRDNGVALGDGEQKKGVEISLTPDGSISGRVVNEEGMPVRNCGANAAQFVYEQNRRTLRAHGFGSANEKGEYHIENLAAGHYYVFVHCRTDLPAAHPLLPRGDPRMPHETYYPQFYGGGVDPAAATRLNVVAGASLDNIDFQLTRGPAYTLRGSVTGGDQDTRGSINVMLAPVNRTMRTLMQTNSGADAASRKFQIEAVIPGSYLLTVFSMRDGHAMAAERPVEIGPGPPDPVQISLQGGTDLKGSVQFDSDDHPAMENAQVSLAPVDGTYFMPQLQAQVDKDGGFMLPGVLPGRWRLFVGMPGYLKSASLGGQAISPGGFQIAPGTTGPLRLMIGSKMADVHVEIANAPADRLISALIFPEDASRLGMGLERAGMMGNNGVEFGALAPGRYRVFATDSPNPWPILQRPDWLKALGSRCASLEVPEGGQVSATVEIIAREELMRVMEEKE
ncbi:MAG: carboxypeptidase-like regulatory domain-containing protein [Bryobacteraceae bacterium]